MGAMKDHPKLRRYLSVLATSTVLIGTLIVLACSRQDPAPSATRGDRRPEAGGGAAPDGQAKNDSADSKVAVRLDVPSGQWPMFGGSPSRNMVDPNDKDIPTEWNIEKAQEKNIKWVAEVGSRAYGGPVVAAGKVFVGTNNERPRNKRDFHTNNDAELEPVDKGVLMCFDEKSGLFLWQAVFDKLESGQVQDWPKEGLCSSPA